jgi:hypothetical protein
MQLHPHFALYHQSPASLWQRCAAQIRDSAAQNMTCAYLTDAHAPQLVHDALCQHLCGFDVSHIVPGADLYLQASPVRVSVIAHTLREWIVRRLQETRTQGI